MPQYSFLSFAADNISNPNGAGGIPKEQQGNGHMSDLAISDEITWLGNGEKRV